MNKNRKFIFPLLLVAWIFFGAQVNAQAPKKTGATITGLVLGADGKPVPHAIITCETSSGLHPRAVHADSRGRFFITGLKRDSYDLRAASNGAYSDWERNIPLLKSQTKEITLQLLNGNTALIGTPPPRK